MTIVVAGVLRHAGKILICRRRSDQPHALKWEFPGGKLESGELAEAALVRELREELGIEAAIAAELMRYTFEYPGKPPIQLIFFEVTGWFGRIENKVFETIVWEFPAALNSYDFLEGDVRFLAALTALEARTELRSPGSATS